MRDHLVIYVNGRRREVRGADALLSLSDWLRYRLGLVGTKVVCAEGDCGSCSVFVGRALEGRMVYRTITSCIAFLYQLDATHVITVEGLKEDGRLNAVQEAMVACQGAQCGYCTPGIVVALCALLERAPRPDEQAVRAALVGNLCRCTGYEPIVRAGVAAGKRPRMSIEQIYPPDEMVSELSERAGESVMVRDGTRVIFKPVRLDEAVRFRAENPACAIFAGGTDLGVMINKGMREIECVLAINALAELQGVRESDGAIVAGAGASIAELEEVCEKSLPEYAAVLKLFGSPPIRNAGTIGGNITNGSPIGDTMPAMYVLNAEIELVGVGGARRVNINDFYSGYRATVMGGDELIARVIIPLPREGEILRLCKVSRRKDLDISAFTAAVWMRMSGARIDAARIAYGGVGPVILRLHRTEQFLLGQTMSERLMIDAGQIVAAEITPISDVRGSDEYRRQLGRNILRKVYAHVAVRGNGDVVA